jgi:hypothetical protein
MILGLDISTSMIGWSVFDEDQILMESGRFKPNKKLSLEERAQSFGKFLLSPQIQRFNISKVYIEAPFSAFAGGKTSAKTMSSLQRFNGMVSFISYQIFKSLPVLVKVAEARKNCGIKVPRGTKAKSVVLAWVDNKFEDFEITYTKFGNPKAGCDDEADAIVIGLFHFDLR